MTDIICPACSYGRQLRDEHCHPDICPACGIVYHKWQARQQSPEGKQGVEPSITMQPHQSHWQKLHELFTYVPQEVDSWVFWSRVVLLAGFTMWGIYFIQAGIDWQTIGGSFMHNINLPFHEFGHVLFMPFGRFMTILGGSLFQVLMPIGLMLAFILKRQDTFAGSIMLWWSGQSFIDVAPYIADAPYRAIPLIGGMSEDAHDWGNLLTMTNSLDSAGTIANLSFSIGTLLMVVAMMWGCRILYLQKNHIVNRFG